ncbi:MAG: ClpXP protease specificity-enhancing factor, partial [Burkholderiales bacterium]|nr:ClpXP protease specificity-enhancing factor [Burkholderiales bacterium]
MKDLPSTRPYLIRAMHQWCEDNGFTAYLAVAVDGSVRVPRQHVVDGEIVLNASLDATGGLVLGNDFIEFKARFGGIPQSISIPVGRVHAIYAKENGQGMAFPVEDGLPNVSGSASNLSESAPEDAGGLT